jgi:hypothetical protein
MSRIPRTGRDVRRNSARGPAHPAQVSRAHASRKARGPTWPAGQAAMAWPHGSSRT